MKYIYKSSMLLSILDISISPVLLCVVFFSLHCDKHKLGEVVCFPSLCTHKATLLSIYMQRL